MKSSAAANELKGVLIENSAYFDAAWVPRAFSYMRFLVGGKKQEAHQDYPTSVLKYATKKDTQRIPASIVFAFEEDIKLKVFEGCFDARDYSKGRFVVIPVG